MDKIAVLIPCFNESLTVAKVVTEFKAVLPEATIYVYDNNSTDGTDRIAKDAGAIVRYEHQQGKGNVIRRMFAEIDAQCYLMVDGDDTYAPESAPDMVAKVLLEKADMVIGDRLSSTYYEENKRTFHNLGNYVVCKSINTLFRSQIKDVMTGYRAFSYRFVKTFPVLSKNFEIETEMTIHAIENNMFISNEIVDYRDRPEGSESKLNTFSDGVKVLLTIVRLFSVYHPGVFWGIVSVALAVLSLFIIVPVLLSINQKGIETIFQFVPSILAGCFMLVCSIHSFFTGRVLQNITHKNRQDFEISLYRATMEHEKLRKE